MYFGDFGKILLLWKLCGLIFSNKYIHIYKVHVGFGRFRGGYKVYVSQSMVVWPKNVCSLKSFWQEKKVFISSLEKVRVENIVDSQDREKGIFGNGEDTTTKDTIKSENSVAQLLISIWEKKEIEDGMRRKFLSFFFPEEEKDKDWKHEEEIGRELRVFWWGFGTASLLSTFKTEKKRDIIMTYNHKCVSLSVCPYFCGRKSSDFYFQYGLRWHESVCGEGESYFLRSLLEFLIGDMEMV